MISKVCGPWALLLSLLVGLPQVCLAAAEPAGAEEGAEAHDDHGEHAHFGAAGANSDPSELRTDLAIYTFIVFLLLMLILGKFAWKPIAEGLDRREAKIQENIAAAQRSHAEAKQLLEQYEARLANAQEEVRAIIEEARRDAEHTQQEILAKARSDAQTEMNRALREVETAKDQALKELATASANQAVMLASRILKSQVQSDDHQRLISEAMAGFAQGNGSNN